MLHSYLPFLRGRVFVALLAVSGLWLSFRLADSNMPKLPQWGAGSASVKEPLPRSPYRNIRAGLPHFYEAVRGCKNVTVAFLGGSITHNKGWRDKTSAYFQETYPAIKFTFIAAGIPSLGSLPHAFRLQQDVLEKGAVDLLFVEAAVNDRTNETDSLTQIRALEGIVRHTRKANPNADIILMSFADPDKTGDFEQGKTPVEIANHERVADHYQLPSLNLAREVYDRMKAGEFTWKDDFKDLHPSPFGQELYYQSIKELLAVCADEKAKGVKKALPKPLEPHNFERGHYQSIRQASLQPGWKLVESWKPQDNAGTRAGFVDCPVLEATKPWATLTMPFTGSAVGIAVLSGPDTGRLEYRIDEGPFRKLELYTQWSHMLYLPWYKLLAGDLPKGNHMLTLRVSPEKHPKSTGTACRIVNFLVNGP